MFAIGISVSSARRKKNKKHKRCISHHTSTRILYKCTHTHTRADRIDLPMLQCEKLNASSHSAHTGQKKAQLIEMDEKKKKCSVGFSQGKIETNDDVYLYLLTSMSKFIFFSFETQWPLLNPIHFRFFQIEMRFHVKKLIVLFFLYESGTAIIAY